MDNRIMTVFKTMFNDIRLKLKMTVMCSNSGQLFDNNLQIFD